VLENQGMLHVKFRLEATSLHFNDSYISEYWLICMTGYTEDCSMLVRKGWV